MKKLIHLLIAIILTSSVAISQGVNQGVIYEWAKTYGNSGDGSFRNMEVDNSGNIYSVGSFQGSVDFDPGPGTNNISIGGSAEDAYVQKLDSAGNLLWVNAYFAPGGSSSDVIATSVTCDDSNNVYVVGTFIGTVDFDYGPNVVSVGSSYYEMFILKLDSLGNFVWVKNLGAPLTSKGLFDVIYDSDGFIYSVGSHIGDFDIDPGPGVVNFIGNGAFLLKLDLDGNFVDAQQFQGESQVNGYAVGFSLAIDSLHCIYISGFIEGTVDFDPGLSMYNLTSVGLKDCFALKLDSNGNFRWAIVFGGTVQDESKWITLDPFDGVYIGGVYMGTVDFDPGSGVLNHTAVDQDAFIMKLDTAGYLNWVKTYGGTLTDQVFSISTDGAGNSYTTGYFSDTIDFDTGPAVFNMIADTAGQMFVLKLDSAGGFVWAKQFEGTLLQVGLSIHTDFTSDDILIGGYFFEFIDFDPGIDTALFVTPGGKRNFLLKLSQCTISYGIDAIEACEAYTWIDGVTYTSNNNSATHMLSNASATGCDSLVSLNLTINQSSTGIDVVTACDSFVWTNGVTYYTSNSTATDTFVNSEGCDSIVTLNLTLTNVDVSTTTQGGIISANETGAAYQWLYFNLNYYPIEGATNSSYTPLVNGTYAVEITKNNCTDTSADIIVDDLGLHNEEALTNHISIFPNPTSEVVNIELTEKIDFDIRIFSTEGKLVFEANNISDQSYSFKLDVESGVYIIMLESENKVLYKRLLIEENIDY